MLVHIPSSLAFAIVTSIFGLHSLLCRCSHHNFYLRLENHNFYLAQSLLQKLQAATILFMPILFSLNMLVCIPCTTCDAIVISIYFIVS